MSTKLVDEPRVIKRGHNFRQYQRLGLIKKTREIRCIVRARGAYGMMSYTYISVQWLTMILSVPPTSVITEFANKPSTDPVHTTYQFLPYPTPFP